MGDLSGKLGTLGLEPITDSSRKTYSFYDENFHLVGPFTGEFRNLGCYASHHPVIQQVHRVLVGGTSSAKICTVYTRAYMTLQSLVAPLWCMVLVPKVVNSLVVPTLSHHL